MPVFFDSDPPVAVLVLVLARLQSVIRHSVISLNHLMDSL